ncbi:Structural maintenance of chromosomes protein 4 [Exophiala xenobiotica]|nr:Structural maintenance of chromosomes protein 4 [Exophiala xenobiotica]
MPDAPPETEADPDAMHVDEGDNLEKQPEQTTDSQPARRELQTFTRDELNDMSKEGLVASIAALEERCHATQEELEEYWQFIRWREDTEFSGIGVCVACLPSDTAYVMDEIDAALDSRNVSIVAGYIKQRTKNAQFIVISLRNNMFELAERLVGIYKVNHMTKSVTVENRDYLAMGRQRQIHAQQQGHGGVGVPQPGQIG